MVPNVKSNPVKQPYTEASADAIAVAGKVPMQLFIGGEWLSAKDARALDVVDPSTATVIAKVADGDVADAVAAVDAAAAAADAWKATSPRRRSDSLMKCLHLMLERSDWLASLISAENGKARPDARSEVTVTYAAEFVRCYAEEAVRPPDEFGLAPSGVNQIIVNHEPIGVAVLVTPWNFPAAIATRLAPALAAGCTCILNPAAAPVAAFDTEDEVVRMANDTEYGPVAYLFSRDWKRALAVAGGSRAGWSGSIAASFPTRPLRSAA